MNESGTEQNNITIAHDYNDGYYKKNGKDSGSSQKRNKIPQNNLTTPDASLGAVLDTTASADWQNNATAAHDYNDGYYLKNNPNKKTDAGLSKNNDSGNTEPSSVMTQNFYSELTTADPALGAVLNTDAKTLTLKKHSLGESNKRKTQPTVLFLEEPSDMSFLEVRKKLNDLTNTFFNETEGVPVTQDAISELYDLILNNLEKPSLSKAQIPIIESATDQVLQNQVMDSLTKAKMLYIAFDFNSLIDKQYKTDSARTLNDKIAKMIKSGLPGDISVLSELIKLASPHNNLTDQIINYIIPVIEPPLENVQNQIGFALNCLDQRMAKLNYFNEIPYFKEKYKVDYKKINEINYYIEKIFLTSQNASELPDDQRSLLEELLSKNMDLYRSRLGNLSDDDMDHDHIAALFRSITIAHQLNLNFDRNFAIDIFNNVYNGIFLYNGGRVGDHILTLTNFCDTFGLESLRDSILTRGIKFVRDDKVKEQINAKYGISI